MLFLRKKKKGLVLQKQVMWKDKREPGKQSSSRVGAREREKRGEEWDPSSPRMALTLELCHLSRIQTFSYNQETKRQNADAEHKKKQMNPKCTKSVTGAPTQSNVLKWPQNTTSSIVHHEARIWRVLQTKDSKETSHFHSISWQCRGSVGTKREKKRV